MQKLVMFVLGAALLGGVGCHRIPESPKKIAITTSSEEARAAFLKGRDLMDKLRFSEAKALLEEATKLDPNFALAHGYAAYCASTSNERFAHIKAAVAAAGKATEGEQILIRAVEAGANGDRKGTGEFLAKLAAAYPEDERAHQQIGTHYVGIRQYDAAIAECQKAIQLAPDFAPAYNMLGYALRGVDRDAEAEKAFRKYVEMIPDEPNGYDSLAELLMKAGRFDESVANYRKAVTLNPKFASAYQGIATNLIYQDKHAEARAELEQALGALSDSRDQLQTLQVVAISYTDEGKLGDALETLSKMSALSEKLGDKAAMARQAQIRGGLLWAGGKIDDAKKEFAKALNLSNASTAPDAAKKNFDLELHGWTALLASAKKDFKTAASEAEIVRAGAEASGSPRLIRAAHETLGVIALQQSKYDEAIAQFKQADLREPYTLLQLAKAYNGKKDTETAKLYRQKAANANTLPDFWYALIRKQAKTGL